MSNTSQHSHDTSLPKFALFSVPSKASSTSSSAPCCVGSLPAMASAIAPFTASRAFVTPEREHNCQHSGAQQHRHAHTFAKVATATIAQLHCFIHACGSTRRHRGTEQALLCRHIHFNRGVATADDDAKQLLCQYTNSHTARAHPKCLCTPVNNLTSACRGNRRRCP